MINRIDDNRTWLNLNKNKKKTGRIFCLIALVVVILAFPATETCNARAAIKLGNEVLLESYFHLIDGKNVGLVTNQTGVDSRGISFIDILADTEGTKLVALYAPEHGIDGTDRAGAWVESYIHSRCKW